MKSIVFIAIGILLGGLMLDSALILKRYGYIDVTGNMFNKRPEFIELGKLPDAEGTRGKKNIFVLGKDTLECKRLFNVDYIDNRVARCTTNHWETAK